MGNSWALLFMRGIVPCGELSDLEPLQCIGWFKYLPICVCVRVSCSSYTCVYMFVCLCECVCMRVCV